MLSILVAQMMHGMTNLSLVLEGSSWASSLSHYIMSCFAFVF